MQRAYSLMAALLVTLAFAAGEASAQLSKDDQKCVNEINKNVEKVTKALNGNINKCIKDGSRAS